MRRAERDNHPRLLGTRGRKGNNSRACPPGFIFSPETKASQENDIHQPTYTEKLPFRQPSPPPSHLQAWGEKREKSTTPHTPTSTRILRTTQRIRRQGSRTLNLIRAHGKLRPVDQCSLRENKIALRSNVKAGSGHKVTPTRERKLLTQSPLI